MAEWYDYWLACVTEVPAQKKREAVLAAGGAEALFFMTQAEKRALMVENLPTEAAKPVKQPLLTEKQAAACTSEKTKEELKKAYEEMTASGIRLICEREDTYPKRLKPFAARPYAIFVKGCLPEEDVLSVAVIGARNCSEYGRYTAKQFGERLALSGVSVISGLARGIDGIAQEAAAKAGGKVFGVSGCGIDICYPYENRRLYEQVEAAGGLLSEYPPKTSPRAYYFPQRNRIISGLADCVLLVEAREKSGSLITADFALEQGKELYVIPGRVTDRLSDGCNRLLKQGAGVALSPEALTAELLSVMKGKKTGKEAAGASLKKPDSAVGTLTKMERFVYEALDFYPQPVEKVKERLSKESITLPELSCCLTKLSVNGLAACTAGAYYKKRIKNEIIS